MNIKRSFFTLLMGSAGFGLFLANCTVSTSSSDKCSKGDKDTGCECPGKITGYQVCNSSGVFGDCQCPGTNTAGSSNSSAGNTSTEAGAGNMSEGGTTGKGGTTGNGGATTTAGTATTAGTDAGGVSSAEGGAGGAGGENGGFPDFVTCEDCLMELCPTQFTACLDDPQCFSTDGDGTGEYEAISTCIEGERASGVAKRDAVRGCGVTFGANSNPDLVSPWAPHDMAGTTTDLINCMATSQSLPVDAKWANASTNFPNGVPAPWPNDSCAKLACTSMK